MFENTCFLHQQECFKPLLAPICHKAFLIVLLLLILLPWVNVYPKKMEGEKRL